MEGSKELAVRKFIGKIYAEHKDASINSIFKMCKSKKIPRSTFYSVIKRIKDDNGLERKKGTGKKRKILSPKSKRRLNYMTAGKVARSYMELGRRFNRAKETIKKDLIDMRIVRKRRILAPKIDENTIKKQKLRIAKARKGCLRPSNGSIVIMDDETFLKFKESYAKDYYMKNNKQVKTQVKFRTKEKFPKKLMMWMAISEKGHSEPFFMTSGGGMSAKKYIEECIEKRLLPFIRKFHSNDKIIFWPDLASCHYAKLTLSAYECLGIEVVPKEQNSPDAPHLRPIERFWAELKKRVYGNDWEAKSKEDLIKRVNKIIKSFEPKYFASLITDVKTKLRKAEDQGPESLIH